MATLLVRRGVIDDDGNPVEVEPVRVEGAVWWPTVTPMAPGREHARTAYIETTVQITISLPPGADVLQGDEIITPDGRMWRATGRTYAWGNPLTGSTPGDVIHAEEVL